MRHDFLPNGIESRVAPGFGAMQRASSWGQMKQKCDIKELCKGEGEKLSGRERKRFCRMN